MSETVIWEAISSKRIFLCAVSLQFKMPESLERKYSLISLSLLKSSTTGELHCLERDLIFFRIQSLLADRRALLSFSLTMCFCLRLTLLTVLISFLSLLSQIKQDTSLRTAPNLVPNHGRFFYFTHMIIPNRHCSSSFAFDWETEFRRNRETRKKLVTVL